MSIGCAAETGKLTFTGTPWRTTVSGSRPFFEAPPGSPVIIAGDFNDWGDKLSEFLRIRLSVTEVFEQQVTARGVISYLRRLGGMSTRVQPARTFPAAMPLLRLDRIYLRGFEVESAQVLHGGLWTGLSDHAPIISTLRLK